MASDASIDQTPSLQRIISKIDRLESRKTSERVWEILTRAAIPVVLAGAAALIAHEVRISTMESNRFTTRDAQQLEARMTSRPDWLREDLAEIKEMVRGLEARLRALEARK